MKMGRIIRTITIGVAIAGLATGCIQHKTELPPTDDTAIGFTPQMTRSAVTELGEGDSFAVWGRESHSGIAQMILSQEEVHCSEGIWTYDHIRYWKLQADYDFYAIYPHDTPGAELQNSSAGATPRMVVTDFDARNALDLMAAEQTGILYTGNPAPVVFTFRHLLSKVNIIGRLDPALQEAGISAQIVSAKLYGMPAQGSCTIESGNYGSWSFGEVTTAAMPFCSAGQTALSASGSSLFGELLPFPQVLTEDLVLEIEYEYTDANYATNRFSKSIRLIDAGVTEWNPATGYRYSFTVGTEYILFDKPEVVPWNSASGGIITVE